MGDGANAVTSLACTRGVFAPAAFTCEEKKCDVPSVTNELLAGFCHGKPTNAAGGKIDSGSICTAKCDTGYEPMAAGVAATTLACTKGVFAPAAFTCEEKKCDVPSVTNELAAGACHGKPTHAAGGTIDSGSICTAKCDTNYSPKDGAGNAVPSLACTKGVFAP